MYGSLQRNRLIVVSGIAVVLVLFFVAYWLPYRRQIAQLRERIREASGEVSRQDRQAKRLSELRTELAQIEAHNKQVAERIPETLNVKDFLAAVYSLGQSDSVKVSTVTPQIMTKLVDVQQQNIRLSLVGPFPAIVGVIHKLETMLRKVEITDVEVTRESKADTGADFVEVHLGINLFARPPKSAGTSESG